METEVERVLKSLGFSKNEIVVYLDLLKYNNSTASDISKRTKLHRTNVYDVLRPLENRGIITKNLGEKKSVFNAIGPKAIINYLKQKEKEFKDIIPSLEKLNIKREYESEIAAISYGLPGMKKCFRNIMNELDEIMLFNVPNNLFQILGEDFFTEFHKWRVEKKVFTRVIFACRCQRLEIVKKMPYIGAKCMPGAHESYCPFAVCGKHVFFLLLTKPVTVIDISSSKIAETFKNNFDFIWNQL
ncbi:hypothetical protein GF386_03765 [Candidatus Pacearchaeota archaeon]|nr:hypothetical protein [Candidatus Pacearchaeota archaeon]